jgi:hypothetical protein
MNWQGVLQNASNFIIWCLNQYYWTPIFCFYSSVNLSKKKHPDSNKIKFHIFFVVFYNDGTVFVRTKHYSLRIQFIQGVFTNNNLLENLFLFAAIQPGPKSLEFSHIS